MTLEDLGSYISIFLKILEILDPALIRSPWDPANFGSSDEKLLANHVDLGLWTLIFHMILGILNAVQ